jgi:hypothetical protein
METITLTLGNDVQEMIDHAMADPEILYPGFMFWFSGEHDDTVWNLVGYDQKWLDNNQQLQIQNGNPLFYKIDKYTFVMQQKEHIGQLMGKYMMKSGSKLVVL